MVRAPGAVNMPATDPSRCVPAGGWQPGPGRLAEHRWGGRGSRGRARSGARTGRRRSTRSRCRWRSCRPTRTGGARPSALRLGDRRRAGRPAEPAEPEGREERAGRAAPGGGARPGRSVWRRGGGGRRGTGVPRGDAVEDQPGAHLGCGAAGGHDGRHPVGSAGAARRSARRRPQPPNGWSAARPPIVRQQTAAVNTGNRCERRTARLLEVAGPPGGYGTL